MIEVSVNTHPTLLSLLKIGLEIALFFKFENLNTIELKDLMTIYYSCCVMVTQNLNYYNKDKQTKVLF